MIDKIITDSYYFNSVVLTIFSLFVVSTVFILNCLWCRKKVNTHVSDRFFKSLEENEESYFNDITISTVPRVSFPLQPEIPISTHSFENDFNLPYNDRVSFEPIPKILPKKSIQDNDNLFSQLRPRIAKVGFKLATKTEEAQKQLNTIKKVSGSSFSRDQLQYIRELGVTKLAKVLEGEAYSLQPGRKRTHVTVVMVDASSHPSHQATLLHEALAYREVQHSNVMRFFCLCTHLDPCLAIYESFKLGDLKTYLRSHRSNMQVLLRQGVVLSMMCDVAAALQALHQANFVHRDLALRNCMLMDNMAVKLGDHGLSEQLYKDDYYYRSVDDHVGIPIRWMAPESLSFSFSISVNDITKEANIWTMGVVMWEMLRCGDVPYPDLSNDYVIRLVAMEKQVKPQRPLVVLDNINYIYELMEMCWSYEVEERPSIRELKILLLHLASHKSSLEDESFRQKWNQLKPLSSAHRGAGGDGVGGGSSQSKDEFNMNNNNNNDDEEEEEEDEDGDHYFSDSDFFGTSFSKTPQRTPNNTLSLADELKIHLGTFPSSTPSTHTPSRRPPSVDSDDLDLHEYLFPQHPSSTNNHPPPPSNHSPNTTISNNNANSSSDNNTAPNITNPNNTLNPISTPTSNNTTNLNNTNPSNPDNTTNPNNTTTTSDLTDASYTTAFDSSATPFEDLSFMKMHRYNNYLNTVTTSIDDPSPDVLKSEPKYQS